MIGILLESLQLIFSIPTIWFLLGGVFIGILFGAFPGVGALIAMAIALPFTFGMESTDAIILMVSIYVGGMYGSCIAAILINSPGSPAAAATALEGYPMTQNGRGKEALILSALSSSFGGVAAAIICMLMIPFVISILLAFQSPEYALITLLGLAMIAFVTQGTLLKGLIAGLFGLMVSTVGMAPTVAQIRFSFGFGPLGDGIHFVPALLGLFALAEMFRLAEKASISDEDVVLTGSYLESFKTWIEYPLNSVKSVLIGVGMGIIPGAGASVGNFVSYSEAVRTYGADGNFGEGDERGVIATETTDNSTVAGALIPTLAFGIPGSASTAILLGTLIFHGLQPGPHLFQTGLDLTLGIFLTVIVGNVIVLFAGLAVASRADWFSLVNPRAIIPFVIVLCVLGTLILRLQWIDVAVLLIFGLAGLLMHQHGYSLVAFVLGIVLGPIFEVNMLRSLQLSGGSPQIFVDGPIAALLTLSVLAILMAPLIKRGFQRARNLS